MSGVGGDCGCCEQDREMGADHRVQPSGYTLHEKELEKEPLR